MPPVIISTFHVGPDKLDPRFKHNANPNSNPNLNPNPNPSPNPIRKPLGARGQMGKARAVAWLRSLFWWRFSNNPGRVERPASTKNMTNDLPEDILQDSPAVTSRHKPMGRYLPCFCFARGGPGTEILPV